MYNFVCSWPYRAQFIQINKKTLLGIQPITLYPKFLLHNPSFLKLEDMGALGSKVDLAPEPCDLLMCVHRNPNQTNTD